MKHLSYIALSVCVLCSVLCAPIQAQDFSRMSERSIMGTARYVGMGGAMTAIGGDPSAVLDNAAGLGLYRRFEALFTMDEMIDRTQQITASGFDHVAHRNIYMITQASLVFGFPTYRPENDGIQFHNIMFSYHRVHTFNRSYLPQSGNDPSLGSLLNTLPVNWDIPFNTDPYNIANRFNLRESGYVNEYTFDYAMNIADKWYIGLGLHMQSYTLSADANYQEDFATSTTTGVVHDNWNTTTLLYTGVTCNLSAGLIYRPFEWLRLGVGFQTPTIGSLNISSTGTLSSQTDSLRYSYAPDNTYHDGNFHMPLHLSTSVAFQIGAYGMIGLQYDYRHSKYTTDQHSLRAGIEVIPVMGMYVNLGYAYESSFKTSPTVVAADPAFVRQDTYFFNPKWSQYASIAIGYRGTYFIAQAAYQYRWQRTSIYAHELVTRPYDMFADTHRIVFTFGWHSN